ncbi:hypothetical protein EJB05_32402, partial [Eragrostis curvula]
MELERRKHPARIPLYTFSGTSGCLLLQNEVLVAEAIITSLQILHGAQSSRVSQFLTAAN